MSCVKVNTKIEIELTDYEETNLVNTYRILKNISDEMWNVDQEDSEEAFMVDEAKRTLLCFLDYLEIDAMD